MPIKEGPLQRVELVRVLKVGLGIVKSIVSLLNSLSLASHWTIGSSF